MTEKKREIAIEYSVFLEDGTQVDSNVGGEPLVFREGESQILSALEKEIVDVDPGEKKRVTLPPEKAYGPVQPDAFQQVKAESVPENARKEGTLLVAEDGGGNRRQVRVHEVRDDAILVDFNHPLAGKTVTFEVKVLEVRP